MAAELHVQRRAEWQWTATGWARAHRLALIGLLASLFAFVFVDGTEMGLTLAAFFTVLCGSGLVFSRAAEPTLTDLLRGLSPRDCVLYFLLHAVVLVTPGFFGYPQWTVALAALLGFLSFLAIDKLGFGRIYATSLLMVFIASASEPLPHYELLAIVAFFLLLCYRLEHLSLRLGRYGDGRGVPVFPAATQTFVWLILPWIASTALFAWLAPQMAPHVRFLAFEPGAPTAAAEMGGDISIGGILRDFLILMGLVAVLVFVIWWFERRLGLKRSGRDKEVEEKLSASSHMESHSGTRSPAPLLHVSRDARGRILARFKAMAEAMARDGWSRGRGETASEYLARVRSDLGVEDRDTRGLSPFQRACYSPMDIVEEDAEQFVRWAASAEEQVHELAERLRQADAAKDAMP